MALWLLTQSSLIWQPLSVPSPIASPPPSTLPQAELPLSPATSSTKLRPALKSNEAAASRSADRAFSRKQPLEQLLEGGTMPPEWEARRTLPGAFVIKIDYIQPDPTQPRQTEDEAAHNELTQSIRTHGILQPITVRHMPEQGMYQIISGERRYLAAKAAGLTEMPCCEQSPDDGDILVRQIVENWQRTDLHPFDLADTLMRLRDEQHHSQKEIADLTGKPESEISKLLSLLKLRGSIQQQYRRDKTGILSRRHLENIAKLPEEQQEAFYAQAAEQKLTAKETEKIVQEKLEENRGARRPGAPIGTRMRFTTPAATVSLSFRRKKIGLEDIVDALDHAKRQAQEEDAAR